MVVVGAIEGELDGYTYDEGERRAADPWSAWHTPLYYTIVHKDTGERQSLRTNVHGARDAATSMDGRYGSQTTMLASMRPYGMSWRSTGPRGNRSGLVVRATSRSTDPSRTRSAKAP